MEIKLTLLPLLEDTRAAAGDHRLDEAAAWHVEVRHRAELGLQYYYRFFLQLWEQWSSGEENRAAYDKIDSVLRKIRACPQPPLPSEAECAADKYDGSVSVVAWLALTALWGLDAANDE